LAAAEPKTADGKDDVTKMVALRALIVEDSETDCQILVRELHKGGYDVTFERVDSAESVNRALAVGGWDIIFSDFSIPGFNGVACLRMIRERGVDVPFIFVSGTIGEEVAVEAMKLGANDYLMKGSTARLLPAIRRELADAALRREHDAVQQRMRQLEKFEAIGKLAGGIAHDFNNVIGAVSGWAELGLIEAPSSSAEARYFEKIREQSRRAAGLTRQLLAYARKQKLEPRNVELNQMVIETMALLRRVIGEHIQVILELSPEAVIVRADPTQIEQVLMNLCLNSRDAMAKGGELTIKTEMTELGPEYCEVHPYAKPGSYIQLSVSDTGIGMDGATIEHIFEPFFTTKEAGEGTGLGLPTAFGIVKQHNGMMEVESEPATGTTFKVLLPAVAGAPDPRIELDNSPVRGGSETILVVEDNDGMRQMMREALEGLGYKVIAAQDGLEAIEQFQIHRSRVSLVVLDMVTPKMSGPAVYARMSETVAHLPVIFCSGYSEDSLPELSAKAAPHALLQKPFDCKVLARKIRELLDSRQPTGH
jgi:two-component system, cell cycle sensor histidine kinase and response regulator CckA